ncbi:MAG: hypothetical protein IKR73_09505 [Oscillospiraceae bacterium]|nr:hypothetical protein [Oscillospiraceae bacterium]
MDDEKINALSGVIKAVAAEAVYISVLFKSKLVSRMSQVDDPVISTVGKGLRILTLQILVMITAVMIYSVVWCILVCTGQQGNSFGRGMMNISYVVKNSVGYLVMIVMGALAAVFPVMAMLHTSSLGDTGLLIVVGIFVLFGIAMIAFGIRGLVGTINKR